MGNKCTDFMFCQPGLPNVLVVLYVDHVLCTEVLALCVRADQQQRSLEEAEFLSLFPGLQGKGSATHISQASLLLRCHGVP